MNLIINDDGKMLLIGLEEKGWVSRNVDKLVASGNISIMLLSVALEHIGIGHGLWGTMESLI